MLRKLKTNCSRRRMVLAMIPLAIVSLLGATIWCQPKDVVAASKPTYTISVDVWNHCGKPCRVRISTGPGITIKDVKLQPGKMFPVSYKSDSYITRFEFTPDGGDKYTISKWPSPPFKCGKWKWTAYIKKTSNPRKVTADFAFAYQCP